MEEITTRTRWNEAAIAGLALGGFTIVMQLLAGLAAKITGGVALAMLASVLKFVLWAVKLAGCIWLMRFFMLKLASKYSGVGNEDTRKFGMGVALLSALIVSAYVMASLSLTDPAEMQAAVDSALANYPMAIDSNTQYMMDKVMDKLPIIYFFVNLVYCFLFGTVVSAILSRNIPSRNPFDSPEADEQ